MITVHLPCSYFSYRILTAHYPEQPLRINRGDVIYRTLNLRPSDNAHRDLVSFNLVTVTIPILVNKRMAKHVEKYGNHIGYQIHKIHCERLWGYLQSARDHNISCKAALRTFFDKYQIDIDEWDIDSMYRQWDRKKINKSLLFLRTDSIKKQTSKPLSIQTPAAMIDEISELLVIECLDHFFTATFYETGYDFLLAWLHYRLGGRSQKEVADHLGISRQLCNYRIRKMREWLSVTPDLATHIDTILQPCLDAVLAHR